MLENLRPYLIAVLVASPGSALSAQPQEPIAGVSSRESLSHVYRKIPASHQFRNRVKGKKRVKTLVNVRNRTHERALPKHQPPSALREAGKRARGN